MADFEDRGLDLLEANTHSFVLRMWCEEQVTPNGKHLWRGHITHVLSGQRRYFQQLGEVANFINSYLPAKEATRHKRVPFLQRLQHGLCRRLQWLDEQSL